MTNLTNAGSSDNLAFRKRKCYTDKMIKHFACIMIEPYFLIISFQTISNASRCFHDSSQMLRILCGNEQFPSGQNKKPVNSTGLLGIKTVRLVVSALSQRTQCHHDKCKKIVHVQCAPAQLYRVDLELGHKNCKNAKNPVAMWPVVC